MLPLGLSSRIALSLGGAALLAAAVYGIYAAGKRAGEDKQASTDAEQTKALFERIDARAKEQFAAQQAVIEQFAEVARNALAEAGQANRRAVEAAQRNEADRARVAALPDSAVKSDLEAKLGGPLEQVWVLRRADDMVTQFPNLQTQLQEKSAEAEKLNQTVSAQAGELTATQRQRDSAVDAYNGLVPLYRTAYDAASRRRRNWYCLWLCTSKPKLSLPDPLTLPPAAPVK
jgi:hypothetical protein